MTLRKFYRILFFMRLSIAIIYFIAHFLSLFNDRCTKNCLIKNSTFFNCLIPLVPLLFATFPAYGTLEELPVGGKSIAMGSAYVAVALGPECLVYNPAGASLSKAFTLSLFVSRPLGLRELTYGTISAVLPSKLGHFSLLLQHFGYNLYQETTFALGCASHYRYKFNYGILVRMNRFYIKDYGSTHTLVINMGCLLTISKMICIGLSVTNLNQSRSPGENGFPVQMTRFGICYRPLDKVTLSIEFDKEPRFPIELKAGIEIVAHKAVCLRCGIGRDPSFFSYGIGLKWNFFTIDYATTSHPVLGFTHQGSCTVFI